MGEAKRRKQALGKAYGEVPPVLVPNSRQFDEHLEKFNLAWQQQLSELEGIADEDEEPDEEQLQAQRDQIKGWIEAYLKPYRLNDQHLLLGGVMDALYAELGSVGQESDPEVSSQGLVGWIMEALTLYAMFKPHLSSTQKQRYGEPLREFYELMLSEEVNMDEEEAEFNQMMIDLFEGCLDDEDD